jgi:hypothetical protein
MNEQKEQNISIPHPAKTTPNHYRARLEKKSGGLFFEGGQAAQKQLIQ